MIMIRTALLVTFKQSLNNFHFFILRLAQQLWLLLMLTLCMAMLVIILAMVHHILATLLLAMVMVMVMDIMDLESVMLRLNQKPRLMLSMDMVLGTALILWDMAMDILATLLLAMVMDMVLAMALMDMESVLLRLKLMLSMDMVLDTACIL